MSAMLSTAQARIVDDLPHEVPACPVCGDGGRTHVYRDPRYSERQNRDLVQCTACGFVYVSPVRPQAFEDVPGSVYLNDWEMLDISAYEHLYNEMHQGLLRLAPNLVKQGRMSSNRLLEVGGGAGYFLDLCRARGWPVAGVEPWRALAQWSRKYLKLDVLPCRLEDAPFEERSFNVIVAHDVIQFVGDPVAFLKACYRLLAPGGVVFITSFNFDSQRRAQEGWRWGQIEPYGHICYFTQDTLRRAARAAGFTRSIAEVEGGATRDEQLKLWARRPPEAALSLRDLTDDADDSQLPPLDRSTVDEASLSEDQRSWRENGVLIKRGFMPARLVDAYSRVRARLNEPRGWHSEYPYMQVEEIRDLCLHKPLADLLEHLVGSPMGMHLNLTGWVSTEREWHQDDYLNPAFVRGHYVAVWFALDTIPPDCGPFEFVPGSHRWPLIRQRKVLQHLHDTNIDDPMWPIHAEKLLTPIFEREIETGDHPVESFLAEKGDVLIWHARLLHRGSLPRRPGAVRKAIIAHYSALDHRPDFAAARRHGDGGHFFVIGEEAPVVTGLRSRLRRLMR